MRSLILTIALMVGSLGTLAITPQKADARPPWGWRGWYNSYYGGPYYGGYWRGGSWYRPRYYYGGYYPYRSRSYYYGGYYPYSTNYYAPGGWYGSYYYTPSYYYWP
jgi:hypothetical protein